jgi:uncharacterized membrane protein
MSNYLLDPFGICLHGGVTPTVAGSTSLSLDLTSRSEMWLVVSTVAVEAVAMVVALVDVAVALVGVAVALIVPAVAAVAEESL